MDFIARNAANVRGSSFDVHLASRNNRFAIRLLTFAFLWLVLFPGSNAFAQERSVPSIAYFGNFGTFYEGEYLEALKDFKSELNGANRTGTIRWIDSICYATMMGECCYQMGDLKDALDAYTDALRIYLMYPDWMVKVEFSPNLRAAGTGSKKNVPWGATKRASKIGQFPTSVLINRGKTQGENEQAWKQGGLVQQAYKYPINPQEIVRCTTLALRRRTELLGPLCKSDALTTEIVSKMTGAIGPPNHWSEAWADLERGLAYVAAGKDGQAMPYLQRSVSAVGEFDHPFTCIALFELGRLALMQSNYKAAANYFEEATYAAVNFGDMGVLEEAFRYAALTHLMSNQQGLCPLLQPAIAWGKVNGGRQFQASVGLSLAENFAVMGQSHDAALMLDAVRGLVGRKKMGAGAIGGRLNYISSVVFFQERKPVEGQKALAEAMGYMKHGSRWLFHMTLADGYYLSSGGRSEGSRLAMELFGNVLRDPLPIDWAMDPMETLAVLTTPHVPTYEHWFECAMQRKEIQDTAMEVSDRVRRHRFFTSLPLGGRLESLRWVLEAPPEWLDKQSLLQRQELTGRYPEYAKLAEQARNLRQKLSAMPIVPEDKAVAREQSQLLADLASLYSRQEAVLMEVSVRREPADMDFPPARKIQDIKKNLPEGHSVLAFFTTSATSRRTFAFLMNNQKYSSWEVTQSLSITKQLQAMLSGMGLFAGAGELPVKDLSSEKWKPLAAKVLETLTKKSPADFSKKFEELVVVPDGVFWYLPFEALQVSIEGKLQPLISRFRIRYAPTISLATSPYPPARAGSGNAAVVWGKIPNREEEDILKPAREKLETALPDLKAIKTSPGSSAVYATLLKQLLVFDDLGYEEKGPYDLVPVPMDRGKPGGTLGDWMNLPWGHPSELILTGFHTTAEDSLKKLTKGIIPGNEIFLSVCGLMSTGTRTILLSRWRTAGQSSYDLVREFAQELPHTSPSDAWQRSVLLEMDSRLNIEAEPRIKKSAGEDSPKGEHPFFWAGYMLFDSGSPGEKKNATKDEPVIKEKAPGANVKPEKAPIPLMPGEKAKEDAKPKEKAKAKVKEEKKGNDFEKKEKDESA